MNGGTNFYLPIPLMKVDDPAKSYMPEAALTGKPIIFAAAATATTAFVVAYLFYSFLPAYQFPNLQ